MRLTVVFVLLGLGFITISYNACGKAIGVVDPSKLSIASTGGPNPDGGGSQCKPRNIRKSFKSPFELNTAFSRNRKKIIIHKNSAIEGVSAKSLAADELPVGFKVAVDVDHDCVNSNGGGTVSSLFADKDRTGHYFHDWELKEVMTITEVEKILNDDQCVIVAAKSGKMRKRVLPNDPQIPANVNQFTSIRASNAYDILNDSVLGADTTVVLAVVDGGVDFNHPDLTNHALVADSYNFADNTAAVVPDEHGTHVAGLAAAQANNNLGVAGIWGRNVRIMSLDVFGSGGANSGSEAAIANAIRHAADRGADVINMSLGGCGESPTIEAAMAYAIGRGTAMFVASGNDNSEIKEDATTYSTQQICEDWLEALNNNQLFAQPYFDTPGSYTRAIPGLVGVGATVPATGAKSSYSNYSTTLVEIGSPGNQLTSTILNNGYGPLSGTSMASPVAAGAALSAISLIRSRGYDPTPAEIEDLMRANGRNVANLNNFFVGGRHLDMQNLITTISQNYPQRDNLPTCP